MRDHFKKSLEDVSLEHFIWLRHYMFTSHLLTNLQTSCSGINVEITFLWAQRFPYHLLLGGCWVKHFKIDFLFCF